MIEEAEHIGAHKDAEYEVSEVLDGMFSDPTCKAAVLLAVLSEVLSSITDIEDVSDVLGAMGQIVCERIMSDHALFNTEGSA